MKREYKVGDKVKNYLGGRWRHGVVTALCPEDPSYVEVKFEDRPVPLPYELCELYPETEEVTAVSKTVEDIAQILIQNSNCDKRDCKECEFASKAPHCTCYLLADMLAKKHYYRGDDLMMRLLALSNSDGTIYTFTREFIELANEFGISLPKK